MSSSPGHWRRRVADPLVVAVDIGGTKTLLTVRSVGELEAGWHGDGTVVRSDSHPDPEAFVDWVADQVDRVLVSRGGRVAGLGVAAPGPLDATEGVITRSSNLGWADVPIAAMLSERLGAPVSLDDDANTAALGEWHFGAGSGADPMGYLTVSSGVGGGVIVGGQVVRGATGNAGEVGHIVMDPHGPRCACGRRGDVESFAGGSSLARRARKTWPRMLQPDGRSAPRTAEDVFRWARLGDPTAQRLADEAAEALSMAMVAITSVLEPAVIVVGGSIGLGQPRLDPPRYLVGPQAGHARERRIAARRTRGPWA